ncbi:hypothetical protein PI126_g19220 [Phytophthora idaei]|nr:hypothetical protein PI126_g19220 [Phytophthora idaei]
MYRLCEQTEVSWKVFWKDQPISKIASSLTDLTSTQALLFLNAKVSFWQFGSLRSPLLRSRASSPSQRRTIAPQSVIDELHIWQSRRSVG